MDIEFFKDLVGENVSVNYGTGCYIGTLVFTDPDTTKLKPSVVNESIGKDICSRLEDRLPTIIDTQKIVGIQPVSDAYIQRILDFKGDKED